MLLNGSAHCRLEETPVLPSGVVEKQHVFDSEHRGLTVGVILAVTLLAFEGLAVVTIAPSVAENLNGMALYGWVFSGFLLASLLSVVVGGGMADRSGPGRPFTLGLALFGVGLLTSGFAPTMPVLILGRVLQGLGGGALVTATYVAITVAYPDALRARMMAFISSAWVLPALLGPAAAGFVAEALGWRLVFWGITPLLVLVAALTVPAFRRLNHEDVTHDTPDGGSNLEGKRLLAAFRLVAGAGLFLSGLSVSPWWLGAVMAVGGVVLGVPALQKLTPAGTLYLHPGLPSVIAARGLFYAAFAGVEAFLALMLTSIHGFSPSVTGVAIATGAISWTLGSWSQERLDARFEGQGRALRIVVGTSLLSVGLAVQIVALFTSWHPLVVTIFGWLLSGLGIGLAHATSSVLAFSLASPGEEGTVSSALQLADTFIAALSTGAGGALFALVTGAGGSERQGILSAFALSVLIVLGSVVAAYRIGSLRAVRARGGSAVEASD